jgi:hypothetical protein
VLHWLIILPEDSFPARLRADSTGLSLPSAHHQAVMSSKSTGALKAFIRFVGLLLLLLGAGAFLFMGWSIIQRAISTGFIWGAVFIGPLMLGLLGYASFTGWRMFRTFDEKTVTEFSAIQSAVTGLAAGEICHLFWPQSGIAVGWIVFLVLVRPLKSFLLRYLGFSHEHPDVEETINPDAEVVGTPWQNNPGYTAR